MQYEEPSKTNWRKLLISGFAGHGAPFAVHPTDSWMARQMVFAAKRHGVRLDEILAAVQKHFRGRTRTESDFEERKDEVRQFVKSVKLTKRKRSAWLITWETRGSGACNRTNNIVAVRDGRTSSRKIIEFVEQYYISTLYTLEEKVHFASKLSDNPYPAEYSTVIDDGPVDFRIVCGDDPYLLAQKVFNLSLFKDKSGDEMISFQEVKWDE